MPRACDRVAPRPPGCADRVVPMHDQYWQTEEAMAEGRPRASWPVGSGRQRRPCCASRARYEEAHPRPDLDEFVRQYRQAGGQIEVTIFEGEGEGLLRNLSSSVARQAARADDHVHPSAPRVDKRVSPTAVIGRHGRSGGGRERPCHRRYPVMRKAPRPTAERARLLVDAPPSAWGGHIDREIRPHV